jgi:hypothetical protein
LHLIKNKEVQKSELHFQLAIIGSKSQLLGQKEGQHNVRMDTLEDKQKRDTLEDVCNPSHHICH